MSQIKGFLFLFTTLLLSGCQDVPSGAPFFAASGVGEAKIIVTNNAAGNESISVYDLDGKLINLLQDTSLENLDPNGIALINDTEFLVSYNGIDQLQKINIYGETVSSIVNTNLNGNIYQMAISNGIAYVIESNTIECFSVSTGIRIGIPCIATTVGACVLSTSRGITINNDGNLVVVGTGNDRILVYDISDPTNITCVSSNTATNGLNPVPLLAHSNGYLYVGTQGDDAIYRLAGDGTGAITNIYSPGTTILNNPTALLELPDGNILVASDGTNTVVKIQPDGTAVAAPFFQSSVTTAISAMVLIGGSD